MRLLLDTHVVLWWLSNPERLHPGIHAAIADGRNDAYVSAVSLAEIAIKVSLGKLTAPASMLRLLAEEGFTELPLLSTHAAALADLPPHHRDPFDRMLVAQCLTEQLVLATHDATLERYGVPVLSG